MTATGEDQDPQDGDEALSRVLVQLADVQRRLLDAPRDDFAARHELRKLQDQLRAEAVALRLERPLTDDERERLQQRLAGLRERREELLARKIDAGRGSGGDAPGPAGAGGVAINAAIVSAGGLDELNREIAVVEQRLHAG